MPKSTTFSNAFALLIFNGTSIPNLADNTSGSPLTYLWVSLHNASPGIGGSQLTNETIYTNYARISVPRAAASGWTVSGGIVSNATLLQFAQCGATGDVITNIAIGTASSGSGLVLWEGTLNTSLTVSSQIQPQFPINTLSITES